MGMLLISWNFTLGLIFRRIKTAHVGGSCVSYLLLAKRIFWILVFYEAYILPLA